MQLTRQEREVITQQSMQTKQNIMHSHQHAHKEPFYGH